MVAGFARAVARTRPLFYLAPLLRLGAVFSDLRECAGKALRMAAFLTISDGTALIGAALVTRL